MTEQAEDQFQKGHKWDLEKQGLDSCEDLALSGYVTSQIMF